MRSNDKLVLRPRPDDSFLGNLEKESISLFHDIKAQTVPGAWQPSQVELKYQQLRELLITMPGVLRRFRHWFLAAGRISFPDAPHPKDHYLQWSEDLAGQKLRGGLHLAKKVIRLYRYRPFRLDDINDNLIGQPTSYRVPKSAKGLLAGIGRRVFHLRKLLPRPECCHVTEAQTRFLYHRGQINMLVGSSFGGVLEVGGGYGGLSGELLQHVSIHRYVLVELPDAMPLAYFYLSACFDCPIQVVYRPDDQIDPKSRIVILVPWKLADLDADIDLLVNIMSFQHMSPESVAFYLDHADRLKTKYLYLVNRDTKRDPTDLPLSRYPIPSCYALQYKKPWLFGVLPEVVYERCSETVEKEGGKPSHR